MSEMLQAVHIANSTALSMEEPQNNKRLGLIAGLIPFILISLVTLSIEWPDGFLGISHLWGFRSLIYAHILLSAGVGIAYYLSFPRWSFPYMGFVFFCALYLMNVRIPPAPVFGLKPWLPVFLFLGIAMVIKHSSQPIQNFFRQIWEDWTLVSFAFFGVCPLFAWLMYDEVRRPYAFMFLPALAVLYILGAYLYLTRRTILQRFLVLFGSMIVTLAYQTLTNAWYWNGRQEGWMQQPGNLYDDLQRGLVIIPFMLIFFFSPALLEAVRWFAAYHEKPENRDDDILI